MPQDQQQSQHMKVPKLKEGVTVIVPIGSAFIGKINECFQQLLQGHEADVEKLKNRNGDYDTVPLTEWENQALMYYSLMEEIMKIAQANNQLEYIDATALIPKTLQADSDPH